MLYLATMKKKIPFRPIIIGNWKMNPRTLVEAIDCAKKIARQLPKKSPVVKLAVPTLFVHPLSKTVRIPIGVQTIAPAQEGAYTGLTSPAQAQSAGASFTLIGHSEERARGVSPETLTQMVSCALTLRLPFVLCVGESVRDKEGEYLAVIEAQIKSALAPIQAKSLQYVTIAYEPVWAIGKNALFPATTRECAEAVIHIRRVLTDMYGAKKAELVPILYGGSVTKDNAVTYIKEGGAQGLLVGRESLKPQNFTLLLTNVVQ